MGALSALLTLLALICSSDESVVCRRWLLLGAVCLVAASALQLAWSEPMDAALAGPELLSNRDKVVLLKRQLSWDWLRVMLGLGAFVATMWALRLRAKELGEQAQRERLGRLKRFFSPQLADLIVRGGEQDPLKTHRREVTVVFLDLRGFTAFAETAEPEEVMAVLSEYHAEMGHLVLAWEGTVERFTGDGIMIFFNDPIAVADASERAVRMALAMRDRVDGLRANWQRRGFQLDFGVGIAHGYATIGAIGFEGRRDYGVIGTVTNVAARLCSEAMPGQILVSTRVLADLDGLVETELVGDLTLKGLSRPVAAFNVLRLRLRSP
jgi:class 3 adenylate cyclase